MKLNEYGDKCFAVGEVVKVDGKKYRFKKIVPNSGEGCDLYSEGKARLTGAIQTGRRKMKCYSIFLMNNKRGVIGWTIMKYDGTMYWTPSYKWYSSHKKASEIRDRLNEDLKSGNDIPIEKFQSKNAKLYI